MGKVRKFIHDLMPESKKKYKIPIADRSLDQMVSLKSLDLKVKKGSFTVIIGETGSGKSSLLNAMIGEMIHLPDQNVAEIGDWKRLIKEGEQKYLEDTLLHTDLTANSPINIAASTSYCEQQPWI